MNEIDGLIIKENFSLKNHNTYKIPSRTKYYIEVTSIDSLINLLKNLKTNNISYFILGAGSNVILDEYFDGVVISLKKLNKIVINNETIIASSGAMMGNLTKESIKENLTGLEWAINIPGTIGGSIVGNAGAYNSEMFDTLSSIKVINKNLEIEELKKEDISYRYRETNIKDLGLIVIEGTFILTKGNKEESEKLIKDRCERRIATQPLDMPSAGSVFRNPSNDYAGRLIEECGLKGKKIGGAEVSSKHANFIVNNGNATSKDIKNLIELIKNEVNKKFGIDLILEQEIIDWK